MSSTILVTFSLLLENLQVIDTVLVLGVDVLKGDGFISLSRIFECMGYRHPDTWQPIGDDARYLLASTV